MLQRPRHLGVLRHPGMLPQAWGELRVGFHPPLPPTSPTLGPKRTPMAPAHPRGLRAPSPVVFLVHEMVPRSERHQPRVVRRGGDGHGAGAAHVGVAQLVREDLQLIRGEPVVIPQHVLVGRSACALRRERGQGERHHFTSSSTSPRSKQTAWAGKTPAIPQCENTTCTGTARQESPLHRGANWH